MQTCFVIQPFDAGKKFDKRFDDVYKPSIESADLHAYRVDRDPNVEIPIESIEEGIRNAAICLADITTDNPNVWYELGFAFASARPVVMVCSDERTGHKFPFDIQHRSIITYTAESSSDFDALRVAIVDRIKAQLNKQEALRQIVESEQVAPTHGLSQPELVVLANLAGDTGLPGSSAALYSLRNNSEQSGLTPIGFSLALRRLVAKGYIEVGKDDDERGGTYDIARVSELGWRWIDSNESLFVLKRRGVKSADFDDDVPF